MTTADTDPDEAPGKKSGKALIVGLLLALLGAGAGFYAAWSGMILQGDSPDGALAEVATDAASPAVTFVSVEPLVVSLGAGGTSQHLRFRADLEVPEAKGEDVRKMLPRIVDVLNSYLRALDPADLEDRAALTWLRAQMLRRVQVVVGEGKVNDLLVMEFVLN